MKALFLVYHGFSETNGISKKIHYQVDALKACGLDVQTCYLSESDGNKYRMIDNAILCDYGRGIKGKLLKRIEFNSIADYAINEGIRFVYIRSDHNANPFTIKMVKKMRKADIRVVMEIPTYPYDNETPSSERKLQRFLDKYFRNSLAKQLCRIVTFSDYKSIFGTSTIQISNGVDFNKIKLKQKTNDTSHELHLIGVAEIHYWHGFDRLVQGLVNYYKKTPDYKVFFHLVGNFFGEREKNDILPLIETNHLEPYIILHGAKHGEELDQLFEQSDMAIGSLARHRSGITNIKTLKNREYAARGLSFIYSEQDSDFEDKPYILKVPADESPIEVNKIIEFYKKLNPIPLEIRSSILSLSWEAQMNKVIKAIEE
ncbi:glycosyltransferase family 1 protein [Parabacteroides sp. AM58-2XD]|uniref:glycosyltransferase family 1 protein n=2 Tax=Bacteroidales TaxID=171549 RepID=UPI000FE1F7B6|nr:MULTISPECIES: glycosyltransferase family 1 protein [Parabacteroides]RGY98138.1 glycosyltransferase family 1 protein [Parabacteroides sp. AM58-2XD]GKG75417.1 glycosyl transferase [Parabacteroides goldsteinii]GKG81176.1 glycosyl transferase [Parabacteroides goldsteinii]